MINSKDLSIISQLRQNSRQTLTKMSKKTNIPISTLYDRLRSFCGNLIVRHTTLLDFNKLGYSARANLVLKVDRDEREKIKEYLMKNPQINSVYKINNGYDFLIEGIFTHVKDLEDFTETIESKFKIKEKKVYYIIDELKREGFLADPELISAEE
jgi:Lrp/AsnC family transcriptional regulator, regulator for asnA, asnC and gidA